MMTNTLVDEKSNNNDDDDADKKPVEDGRPDPLDEECVPRLTGQRQDLRLLRGSYIGPDLSKTEI